MRVLAFGLVVAGTFAFGVWAGYGKGQQHPPCLEDEVMAVQHDPDPSHGLTWACEGLDDLIERQR